MTSAPATSSPRSSRISTVRCSRSRRRRTARGSMWPASSRRPTAPIGTRIAAYSTSTGALVTTWAPALDFRARALAVTNTTVYVGGAFSVANGVSRTRLAAFNASNGALLNWTPTADAQVLAMTLTPDGSKIVVGGQFATLSGASAYGMGALDAGTGAVKPWAANAVLRDAGNNAAINSLETDGTNIYGSG